LEASRAELEQANRDNLPLVRRMLDGVAGDAAVLHMEKEDLIEDFLIAYQEALTEIGFSSREIAKMAAAALMG
jgi:fatty aldehyde decarbonylase